MNILKLFFLCLLLAACGKQIDSQGFDDQIWKNDKDGCNSERVKQLTIFEQKIKPQLLLRPETTLRKLLGKPDRSEPANRGQKFYIYFVQKGKQCDSQLPSANFLQIRIDAIGRVTEIILIKK